MSRPSVCEHTKPHRDQCAFQISLLYLSILATVIYSLLSLDSLCVTTQRS